MTTLYWKAGANIDTDNGSGRVYIEAEGDAVPEEVRAALGKHDGLRGGPEGNRGEYVPVTAEHSKALRAEAEGGGKKSEKTADDEAG